MRETFWEAEWISAVISGALALLQRCETLSLVAGEFAYVSKFPTTVQVLRRVLKDSPKIPLDPYCILSRWP